MYEDLARDCGLDAEALEIQRLERFAARNEPDKREAVRHKEREECKRSQVRKMLERNCFR